jgi:hypothetical protein
LTNFYAQPQFSLPLSTRDVPWFAFHQTYIELFPFVRCSLYIYAFSIIEVSFVSWETRRLMQLEEHLKAAHEGASW